jgi:hypothetical protein
MFHTLVLCIKNIFDTQIYKKMQNSCKINFLYVCISPINTFIHVLNMFSSHDIHIYNVQTSE